MLLRILPFCIAILVATGGLRAQSNIVFINDSAGNDSLQTAARILFRELGRAGPVFAQYETRSLEEYGGRGFLLAERKDATRFGIQIPGDLGKLGPEGIWIKADDRSVTLIGNSALAVMEAVYIYLEQLGFRYYLPGDTWTIIPSLSSVYKKMVLLTEPHYEFRTIANGHAYLDLARPKQEFDSWYQANRMGGAFSVWLGHNYHAIAMSREEIFKQHPEYFAGNVAKGTIPTDPKFNVANKELVKLIIDVAEKDVQHQIANKRSPVFFSMEPSDGGGFCNTPACREIGNASDQVFYLANEVAKALKKYKTAWVGVYAYNEHIVPTRFKLEDNFFVMVTNGFNRSRYNTDELLRLWKKKVPKVGVYEYLSVYEGDMDMPGRHKAGKIDYLKKSVKEFYENGARAYQGESNIGWISRGLGQYILTKLLWNIHVNTDSLKEDFFNKAFHQGAKPMRKLFTAWENYPFAIPFPNDLADWHDWIGEADRAVKDPGVKKRINQVKSYLHYVVMYTQLQLDRKEETMRELLSYTWRSKEDAAFATVPALVSLANYNGFPALAYYAGPDQPWKKNNVPVSGKEIEENFHKDAKKFKKTGDLASFERNASLIHLKDLVSWRSNSLPETPHSFWGQTEFIIRINKKGAQNYFEIASGHAANPPLDRPVSVEFYKGAAEKSKRVLRFDQTKKIEKEKFELSSLEPGFYTVVVNDHQKMFVLQFSAPIDYSVIMRPQPMLQTTSAAGLNRFYFYVPRGVKRFAVQKAVVMTLESPAGRKWNYENNKAETFYIEVQPGEEGLWTIHNQAGWFFIDGVPPYIGSLPQRMLLPAYLKN